MCGVLGVRGARGVLWRFDAQHRFARQRAPTAGWAGGRRIGGVLGVLGGAGIARVRGRVGAADAGLVYPHAGLDCRYRAVVSRLL